jgi:hypothetical protein
VTIAESARVSRRMSKRTGPPDWRKMDATTRLIQPFGSYDAQDRASAYMYFRQHHPIDAIRDERGRRGEIAVEDATFHP